MISLSDNPSSLNNIKDMLAGLPQFQEGKEAFSLHLNMASDAMDIFQKRRLVDIASVEQVCTEISVFLPTHSLTNSVSRDRIR
jgi:hypothetical protein